jgi:hypothetical protein
MQIIMNFWWEAILKGLQEYDKGVNDTAFPFTSWQCDNFYNRGAEEFIEHNMKFTNVPAWRCWDFRATMKIFRWFWLRSFIVSYHGQKHIFAVGHYKTIAKLTVPVATWLQILFFKVSILWNTEWIIEIFRIPEENHNEDISISFSWWQMANSLLTDVGK